MYFIETKYDVLLGKFLERLTVLDGLYNARDGERHLKISDVCVDSHTEVAPANNLYWDLHIFSIGAFDL